MFYFMFDHVCLLSISLFIYTHCIAFVCLARKHNIGNGTVLEGVLFFFDRKENSIVALCFFSHDLSKGLFSSSQERQEQLI